MENKSQIIIELDYAANRLRVGVSNDPDFPAVAKLLETFYGKAPVFGDGKRGPWSLPIPALAGVVEIIRLATE